MKAAPKVLSITVVIGSVSGTTEGKKDNARIRQLYIKQMQVFEFRARDHRWVVTGDPPCANPLFEVDHDLDMRFCK